MISEGSTIDVLLSTFNGENYIEDQINSILPQLKPGSKLIIRDDGSKDCTVGILKSFAEKSEYVHLLETSENIGVVRSFSHLMRNSTAQYIFFCDQDDVWAPSKLETFVGHLAKLEKIGEPEVITPCLIYSEMDCINDDGLLFNQRYSSMHGVKLEDNSLDKLILQNVVTGAACAVNRQLKELALIGCDKGYLHDWWFGLCATTFGRIEVVSTPLTKYRVHANNVVGANTDSYKRFFRWGGARSIKRRVRQSLDRSQSQCRNFVEVYGDKMNAKDLQLCEGFVNLPSRSFFSRRFWLFRNDVAYSSWKRNIALYLYV